MRCGGSGHIITRFKAQCFGLMQWDPALVQTLMGRNFRPLYSIGANPVSCKIWVSTNL